jgi:hypothetical protein
MGCKLNSIYRFLIPATEKISNRYLSKFISSNIDKLKYNIDTKDLYYYSYYIDQIKSYEILLFIYDKQNIPEFFIFFDFYTASNNTTDLFIIDTYFTLYCNGILVCYKEIKESKEDDILLYLNQTYQIKIDNIIYPTKEEIETLKLKHSFRKSKKYIKKLHTTLNIKFITYATLTISAIALILLDNITYTKSSVDSTYKSVDQYYLKLQNIYNQKPTPITQLEDFFKYLKLNKISIYDISYQNDTISTIISSTNKQTLLSISTLLQQTIDFDFINKKQDKFQMGIKLNINPSSSKKTIQELKENMIKKDSFYIVNQLEKEASLLNIDLKDIKLQKPKLILQFLSNYNNSLLFLRYLELHYKIDSFTIKKDGKLFDINIAIFTTYLFNQNYKLDNTKDILNPYINYKDLHTKKIQKPDIKIIAILDNEVLIDKKWYKLNDIINGYKIIKITDDSIQISDKTKTYTIKF